MSDTLLFLCSVLLANFIQVNFVCLTKLSNELPNIINSSETFSFLAQCQHENMVCKTAHVTSLVHFAQPELRFELDCNDNLNGQDDNEMKAAVWVRTLVLPLGQSAAVALPHAADGLRRDGLHVLVPVPVLVGVRGRRRRAGRLAVLAESLQVEQSQVLEEGLPLTFSQLRPEPQDVGLTRSLQAAPNLLQTRHSGRRSDYECRDFM